mmetsp:Transcript_45579/g.108421  ORF Transcript_45579/g.108421 Transcript_45579/m.108421 type:complete len:223 (-) Transcript_45579:69-737(-)
MDHLSIVLLGHIYMPIRRLVDESLHHLLHGNPPSMEKLGLCFGSLEVLLQQVLVVRVTSSSHGDSGTGLSGMPVAIEVNRYQALVWSGVQYSIHSSVGELSICWILGMIREVSKLELTGRDLSDAEDFYSVLDTNVLGTILPYVDVRVRQVCCFRPSRYESVAKLLGSSQEDLFVGQRVGTKQTAKYSYGCLEERLHLALSTVEAQTLLNPSLCFSKLLFEA